MPDQIQTGNNYGGNRRKQRPRRRNNRCHPKATNEIFLGHTPELKGHVYELRKGITRPWKSFDKVTREIADYFVLEFENGADLRTCLLKREFPELIKPTPPNTNPEDDQVGHIEWNCNLEHYLKLVQTRKKNQPRAFSIILGQCSPEVRILVEFREEWKDVNQRADVLGLLKLIEEVMICQNRIQLEVCRYTEALHEFFAFRQGKTMSCNDYLHMFKDLVKTVLYYGGDLGGERERVRKYICNELKQDPESLTTEAYNHAIEECRDRFLAVCFLQQSDPIRFSELKRELHNTQLVRREDSVYPKTLHKAYAMLLNYEELQASSHRFPRQY